MCLLDTFIDLSSNFGDCNTVCKTTKKSVIFADFDLIYFDGVTMCDSNIDACHF